MQDIGGCRAIVRSVNSVQAIVDEYKNALRKNKRRGHQFVKENDYISIPKDDGYRSYHLVYRYTSKDKKNKVFNGLKIEIQIRTRLQHAWATAVEIVSTMSGQPLKSRGGEEDWRRFFALMSSAIAIRERQPTVPGTPSNRVQLTRELKSLSEKLNVERMLEGLTVSLKEITEASAPRAFAYLLTLDLKKKQIRFTEYSKNELPEAAAEYSRIEKKGEYRRHLQSVLVSVSSLRALRKAYPNYFLDATVFLEALRYAVRPSVIVPRTNLRRRKSSTEHQLELFPDS